MRIPSVTSPNGNKIVDSMVSTIAHEIAEAVTDPEVSSWKNNFSTENADLCNRWYGKKYQQDWEAYNTIFGDRKYLIQGNYDHEIGKCVLEKGESVSSSLLKERPGMFKIMGRENFEDFSKTFIAALLR